MCRLINIILSILSPPSGQYSVIADAVLNDKFTEKCRHCQRLVAHVEITIQFFCFYFWEFIIQVCLGFIH